MFSMYSITCYSSILWHKGKVNATGCLGAEGQPSIIHLNTTHYELLQRNLLLADRKSMSETIQRDLPKDDFYEGTLFQNG